MAISSPSIVKDRISESSIKTTFLNTNMGIKGIRDNVKDAIFASSAFFVDFPKEEIQNRSDILHITEPIIKQGGDILNFSEVFGENQRINLENFLISKGYKVDCVPAFHYWGKDGESIIIYNVSAFRGEVNKVLETQLSNKRKILGVVNAAKNLVLDLKRENNNVNLLKNNLTGNYKKFAEGNLLEGAITSYEVENMIFSPLHIHSDNPELGNFFSEHIHSDKPQVFMGDFNIKDYNRLLNTPEFEGKGFQKQLKPKDKTYSFAKGFQKIPGLFPQPDNIVTRNIEIADPKSINSLSDHNAITGYINT